MIEESMRILEDSVEKLSRAPWKLLRGPWKRSRAPFLIIVKLHHFVETMERSVEANDWGLRENWITCERHPTTNHTPSPHPTFSVSSIIISSSDLLPLCSSKYVLTSFNYVLTSFNYVLTSFNYVLNWELSLPGKSRETLRSINCRYVFFRFTQCLLLHFNAVLDFLQYSTLRSVLTLVHIAGTDFLYNK